MDNQNFQNFLKQDFNAFSNWLFSLNAYEFTFIATALGFLISPTLTINQQNSLGNFFELLGQVILTVNAQNTTLVNKKAKQRKIQPTAQADLRTEIEKLKQEIDRLRDEAITD